MPGVHVLGHVRGREGIGLYQQATISVGRGVGGGVCTRPSIERVAMRHPFIGPTRGWFHSNTPPWLGVPSR